MNKKLAAGIFGILLMALGLTAQTAQITPNPLITRLLRSIPLVVGVIDSTNVNYLNSVLGPNDVIAVRPQNMTLLAGVTAGRKMLIFGGQDYDQAATLIAQAKSMGAALIGFNLEDQLSRDELVAKEEAVGKLVRSEGLRYLFGPKVADLEKYYPAFARLADILLLQSQNFQTQSDYKQVVGTAIARIKKARPNIKVWVQVSVNPPGNANLTADQVLRNIAAVADMADGIFVIYNPARWDVAKAVIQRLRSGS